MVYCCVTGCKNNHKNVPKNLGIRFFSIPAVITNQCDKTRELSEERRRIWLERIYRKDLDENNISSQAKVCSRHFLTGAPAKLFQETHPDWVPSVRMGYSLRTKSKTKTKDLLNSDSISKPRILKRKNGDVISFPNTKISKNQETKENVNKVQGILFEHFYCRNVPSDKTSNLENEKTSDNVTVEFIDLGASENQIESSSPVILNSVNSNNNIKVDVACMTTITCDYVTYLLDELNKLKKENVNLKELISSGEKERILKANKEINDNIAVQAELAAAKQEVEMYRKDNIALREEIITMRNCIYHLSLNEAALKADNNKVKFYTGFPNFTLLEHFYNLIASEMKTHLSNSLHKFEEFLVAIMRLRLNCPEKDLGYRFGVSQGTISRICSRWIPVMAEKLNRLQLPEKTFKKVVPVCFKEVLGDQFVVDLEESGKICAVVDNIQKIKAKVMTAQSQSKDE